MSNEKTDIVVVDDNADNLRILSDMLRNHGYCPRPAPSSTMGIDAIIAKPPALILLDIMMPETDGITVCRHLKSRNDTRDIPVIFITAMDRLENKIRAFSAGGVDYIAKPFQEAEVMARIHTHIRLVRAKEDLRQNEARIRQYRKYESLVRMAGAIAHRFNNDLQAIIGNLEMAINDCEVSASVPPTLTAAMESAKKASEMSGLMVTYTGKIRGAKEKLDLAVWCKNNLSYVHNLPDAPPIIDIRVNRSGPVVLANKSQIRQMVGALIQNAIEASGDNPSEILISVETVSSDAIDHRHPFPVGWDPGDLDYACIRISDKGCGIAETDLEQLFDPFFTTHFTGRGLGLPMALGIAIAHSGGIAVESSPGQGSTFRVFLPMADQTGQ